MTIIRNKQTGLEIEGERIPISGPEFFSFKIPGTNGHNTFRHEDWDIINTPKEGVYAFATSQRTDPAPFSRIVKYQAGEWTNADGYPPRDAALLQGMYDRGELRRLTFAPED